MSNKNQAAFMDAVGSRLRVGEAPMPKAEPGRVVIRNKYIAVNPADWKMQEYPSHIQSFPMVLGEDVAGDVVDVGPGVTHIQKGDRVAAHLLTLLTQKDEDGGFALYSSAPAATTAVLPSKISYEEGCVLPTAFDTAATGLYSAIGEGFLGLPFPSANSSPADKTIVVWGGSSSVGAVTIQLAVASGVKVVAVASEHNFDFCRKCGASEVISYKQPNVIENVVSTVKSLGGAFAGVYDAISELEQSFKYTVPITEKLGGGNIATVLPNKPDTVPINVRLGFVICITDLTHPLWRDYAPAALESGQLKCLPEPMVVGRGLESIQKGVDASKKGVSARKIMIEL